MIETVNVINKNSCKRRLDFQNSEDIHKDYVTFKDDKRNLNMCFPLRMEVEK